MAGSFGTFANLIFVVSNTEDRGVEKIIKAHGGKVQKTLTKRTDFFVQGYNIPDDDRLGTAGKMSIRVVAPEYIQACAEAQQLLDINEQALGKIEEGDIFPKFMQHSEIKALFSPVSDDCRELEELPQSFGEFLQTEKYIPSSEQNYIYLLPCFQDMKASSKKRTADGKRKKSFSPFESVLENLAEFLSAFFCLPVKILTPAPLKINKKEAILAAGKFNYTIATHRSDSKLRLDVMEMISCLQDLRPEDGFCILGVTDTDICEDPEDQGATLGRATGDRAGVLSTWFLRNDPVKKGRTSHCNPNEKRSLHALFNTAAHETMHMFGLDHCAYYACVMNSWSDPYLNPAKNSRQVSPLHLCPIDLRKLQHSLKFDPAARYQKLRQLYEQFDIKTEVTWIANILKIIEEKQA